MDNLRNAGVEGVGGGAESGESSLRGEGDEESDDGDNNDIAPLSMAGKSENEKNEEGDGVSVDSAAREGKKKRSGKETCKY